MHGVLIPAGKENKAAAALAGHGRRPDGTLREYMADWLDRWINAPLRDHSRIVHRLQDEQEQLQEDLSKRHKFGSWRQDNDTF